MINPETLTKRYYKIGEVAKMFGVATSLIRYWEGEFSQLHPQKNNKGVRRFLKEDVIVVDKIYDLVKVKGYKLEGAKQALKNKSHRKTDDNSNLSRHSDELSKVRTHLLSIKNDLLELKSQLSAENNTSESTSPKIDSI